MIGHRIGLAAVGAALVAGAVGAGASPASALPRQESCTYILETINLYQAKVDYWTQLAFNEAAYGLSDASIADTNNANFWRMQVNGEWNAYDRAGC